MATIIRTLDEAINYDINNIEIEEYWNLGDYQNNKIHNIHAYPAKFPAFLASKAILYAVNKGVNVRKISDIFCGCGTVAIEAKVNNIDFWGCDINPVATLISTVKCGSYVLDKIASHYCDIINDYNQIQVLQTEYDNANERIRYWFDLKHFIDLKKLITSIERLPNGKYKQVFKCLFSSILKSTSRWLTKSIKPQIDPNKKPMDVLTAFNVQYHKLIKILQFEHIESTSKIHIETNNFLSKRTLPLVDLIITSPPYVTSYEYADLHQLSSLWLGFTDDYTALRKGTIGSIHNNEDYYFEVMDLNHTGRNIIEELRNEPSIAGAK